MESFQKSYEKSDSPAELEENFKYVLELLINCKFKFIIYLFYQMFSRHNGHIKQSNLFSFEDDTVVDYPGLHPGHIMAIVACVMAAICISAYVGLLSWKHYLE